MPKHNPLARDLESILVEVGAAWETLHGARLFVTGGTGFVGRWLLESLLRADTEFQLGLRATVLSRNPHRLKLMAPHLDLAASPSLDFLEGDIRDFPFPDSRFTHVIHAATDPSVRARRDSASQACETIVAGTARTIALAVRSGVSRFLYVSSGAVYGPQPVDLSHLREDDLDQVAPVGPYALGKREAEDRVFQEARRHGFSASVARGFTFIGPHLPVDAAYAAADFLRDALHGGPIKVLGDGTPVRSYLYASDMASWLWMILLRGASGRAYNVGSEAEISIAGLARKVSEAAGVGWTIAQPPGSPNRLPQRYVPSTARISLELGVKSSVCLEDAIDRTLRWTRNRQEA